MGNNTSELNYLEKLLLLRILQHLWESDEMSC